MSQPSIYEQEEQALANRPRGGGRGGDYVWLDIPTPASVGTSSFQNLRVIQRIKWVDNKPTQETHVKFWVRVDQHKLRIDGHLKNFTCPSNHDEEDWKTRTQCPICLLRVEIFATKNPAWENLAKNMGTKVRCFCNVVDLDNPQVHWKQNQQSEWVVRPHVWGYGNLVHKQFMSICRRKNAGIEDCQIGRNIEVEKKRTGPELMNVDYLVGDSDSTPIPPELMPVVHGAWDLADLGKPSTMDQLRQVAAKIDPRSNGTAGHQLPQQQYQQAPPQQHQAPPPYQQAPPPQQQAQGGPPPPAPQPPPRTPQYHYQGPTGQQQGLDASAVARLVNGSPQGTQHVVWTEGMPAWMDPNQVPEIVQAIQATQPQTAGPPPGSEPGYGPQGGYDSAPQGGPPPPQQQQGPPPPQQQQGPPQGPPQQQGGLPANPPQAQGGPPGPPGPPPGGDAF